MVAEPALVLRGLTTISGITTAIRTDQPTDRAAVAVSAVIAVPIRGIVVENHWKGPRKSA